MNLTHGGSGRGQKRPSTGSAAVSALFVVSNLGQMRTAAQVVDRLEIPDARVVVLWTDVRVSLRDRILAAADAAGLESVTFELPRSPTDPFPSQIRTLAKRYPTLVAENPTQELWVANINSHYGHLTRLYHDAGSRVSYFEEGLGSYLSADDPPFASLSRRTRLRHLADAVTEAIRAPRLSWRGRIRRAGHRAARYVAAEPVGEWLVDRLAGREAQDFRHPWTQFQRAAVAFPTALDPRLVATSCIIKLPATTVDRDAVLAAADWMSQESILGTHAPLFLTQPYDVDDEQWASTLAALLVERAAPDIIVKFHPRETDESRTALLDAFAAAGLNAMSDPALDAHAAEHLIVAGLTDRVIGLTSSTLLYRPVGERSVRFEALGTELLARLEQAEVPDSQIRRFRRDVELFNRVRSSVDQTDA